MQQTGGYRIWLTMCLIKVKRFSRQYERILDEWVRTIMDFLQQRWDLAAANFRYHRRTNVITNACLGSWNLKSKGIDVNLVRQDREAYHSKCPRKKCTANANEISPKNNTTSYITNETSMAVGFRNVKASAIILLFLGRFLITFVSLKTERNTLLLIISGRLFVLVLVYQIMWRHRWG